MDPTPTIQAQAGAEAGHGISQRERRRWMVALLLAFVLGFLLAWFRLHTSPSNCRTSSSDSGSPQAASGSAGSHGAPDKGSGVKLGAPGEGDATRKRGAGTTVADGGGGAAGKGAPGDGDFRGGTPWKADGDVENNGSGISHATDSPADGSDGSKDMRGGGGDDVNPTPPQNMNAGAPQQGSDAPKAGGAGNLDGDASPPTSIAGSTGGPAPDAVMAKDLRYDKSGLPRYPNSVTTTASGMPALAGRSTDPNVSISALMTKDDLPTVAAWYHEHLPGGWVEQNLGQMAMFWPPDRKADPRTLWLVVDPRTGQTGVLLWKAKK